MNDEPLREPPPGTKRVYSRPPVEGSDEEVEAWAAAFANAALGPTSDDQESESES